MSPRWSVVTLGALAAFLSVIFVMTFRMPLPFNGASVAIASSLSFLLTLTLVAWVPRRWVWTDGELLVHAFRGYHDLSAAQSEMALNAITTAHQRAEVLRKQARPFHADLKRRLSDAADRLDASAREIFYAPERLRALRPILLRSELIEEAARAHGKLRHKAEADSATAVQSRSSLIAALSAMEMAFAESDLSVARAHFDEVRIASSVAESLLAPRKSSSRPQSGDPK